MEVTLEGVRQAALACAALAVVLVSIKFRAVLRGLRNFLFEPGSAAALALMRITVFWMLFERATPSSLLRLTELPAALRQLPYGWGWLEPILPFEAHAVRAITIVFGIASALAMLGLFTRVSAAIAAVLGLYVMGIPNFYAKIDHGSHCIAMFSLVLAVSPCADALSLDRLWRRYRGQAPPALSAAYTLPVRFCFLILGTVYLFPGLWKLWRAGDLWIRGVQLPAMLQSQWSRVTDFIPLWRADEQPFLMVVLGAGTLLFEIGFIFLLFNRWTRVLAAFSAVVFHWSIWVLMGIRFHILLPLVLLFDLPGLPNALVARFPRLTQPLVRRASDARERIDAQLLRWLGPVTQPPSTVRRIWIPAALMGTVLFSAQLCAGIAPLDSWPIAIHPRFDRRLTHGPTTRQRVAIVVDRASGAPSIDMGKAVAGLGPIRGVRLVQRLRGLQRSASSEAEIAAAEQAVIEFIADSGVKLAVGDRVSVLGQRWRMFPLDRRDQLKTTVLQRWEVTPQYRLGPQTDRWKHKKKKKMKMKPKPKAPSPDGGLSSRGPNP